MANKFGKIAQQLRNNYSPLVTIDFVIENDDRYSTFAFMITD